MVWFRGILDDRAETKLSPRSGAGRAVTLDEAECVNLEKYVASDPTCPEGLLLPRKKRKFHDPSVPYDIQPPHSDIMRHLLLLLFCGILTATGLRSQSPWSTGIHAGIGANFLLHRSAAQRFPGLRMFASVSVTGTWKDHLLLHYGPALSVYTRTIGSSMNPLVGDLQVDFSHTFSFGWVGGPNDPYPRQIRTLHTGDYYNLVLDRRYGLVLSTNAIFNNHRRNQMQGAMTIVTDRVSLNYYNDGPPFQALMLADGFDRFWTGGGSIFVHDDRGFNRIVAGFDQFTGYQPLLYELSGLLGIHLPQYGPDGRGMRRHQNTSQYHLRIGLDPGLAIDMGVVGSLYDASSRRYFGLQDIIHLKGGYPFHPNHDANRFFIGAGVNLQSALK